MNAMDHATQAEIRLATLYADYMAAERLIETTTGLLLPDAAVRAAADGVSPKHSFAEAVNAQWTRRDHYLDTLRELARELDMDLALIFDVAREIREAAEDSGRVIVVGP